MLFLRKYIISVLFIGAALVFTSSQAEALDCPPPPPGGNYTISASCSFNTALSNGVNGVDGGKLIINRGSTLTVNSGQTIVFNPGTSPSNPGVDNTANYSPSASNAVAIHILSGGKVQPTNLWMQDSDGNGYPASMNQIASAASPGSGYVRRSTLVNEKGVKNGFYNTAYSGLKTVIDCNETADGSIRFKCPIVSGVGYVNNATSNTNNVNINMTVSPGGYATEYWVRYWRSGEAPNSCNDKGGTSTSRSVLTSAFGDLTTGSHPVSVALASLDFGTVYKYCALAINSYGIDFGSLLSFTTIPNVTTPNGAIGITTSSATLTGAVSTGSSGIQSNAWFRFDSTNSPCNSLTHATGDHTVPAGNNVPFNDSSSTTGLSQGATYYYCAIAANGAMDGNGHSINGYSSVSSFVIPWRLSVSVSGSGSVTSNPSGINCGSVCSANFNPGNVTLTANPSPDNVLSSWGSPCGAPITCGNPVCSGSASTCTVNMNGNKNVTATFVCAQHSLTVNNGSGAGNYCSGTSVSISANSSSYPTVFTGWTGDPVANSSARNTTITMPSRNASVTANYHTYSWQYCVSEEWPITGTDRSHYCSFTGWTRLVTNDGQHASNYKWSSPGDWCNVNVYGDPQAGSPKHCEKWQ